MEATADIMASRETDTAGNPFMYYPIQVYPANAYPSSGPDYLYFIMLNTNPAPQPTPTAPTPSYGPGNTPPPAINHTIPFSGKTYYLGSDTVTTLGVSGYGLDSDYSNYYQTVSQSYNGYNSLSYGTKIYLLIDANHTSEITSGVATLFTLPGNDSGLLSGSVNIPQKGVILGYQALEVIIYIQYNGGTWTTAASFISPVLITDSIQVSTWTFTLSILNAQYNGNTHTTLSFGDSSHKSSISGIAFSVPKESAIEAWRFSRGDIIGAIIGPYLDILGSAFYALLIIGLIGVFYFRTGNASIITFIFVLFAGANGLILVIISGWLLPGLVAFAILAFAFLLWRLLR